MKFKSLEKESISETEQKISEFWEKENIFNKTIENRKDCKNFVFYDGPATANGYPGLHHMVAKFLKDSFCRYKTMKGYKVLRKIGWDTHGLPVEVEVEKQLGFTSKKDIEEYGIEKFNKKCKEIVWKNEEAFNNLTTKMGQFIDQKNPYVTYDNNYIETEWWILKKFFDEGLFYEGVKILPYCPRCGTGLASHEVAQGYKEITAETVIVPMKKKDEDVYFLVWTTTPWTLIANVALCVNPSEEYIKAESNGYKFILASSLANSVLGEDYKILQTYKGSDLEGIEYDQLIPSLKVDKKAFYVTCDNYVTMDSGTGIVHLAPAFGADDAAVGKKYNLPYLNPVGEDGRYKEGLWKSMFVFDADLEVIKYLKENDKLFKKQKMNHDYPHCWRCNTPLIYYSKPSFYLEVTKIKDRIIEENKSVNWYPSYVGEKRFGNWLENLNDWAISRNRYWGTPLPLWRCSCGYDEMIGSRKELVEKSIERIDESIELHRPYVDDIHIKCPKCGKLMNRVTDVIDCWFDSGSMPFAQYHYPFENEELFDSQFPADFISEGIDQTRGWFYSLLAISTFVKGISPYKNVLVNDLLLDAEGKKMSKSKGNIVEPFATMNTFGADTVRFYLPYSSPIWTPLKFSEEGLKEVSSKYFNTLKNTYSFFEIYANTDNLDPREYEIDYTTLEDIDKWLLSKYNKLVRNVTNEFENYDLNKVVHLLQDFVCDDLSNWYIRRNRRRFWSSETNDSKKNVYKVTYDVLVGLSQLSAPITPFLSEILYKNLTNDESVHLSDYPLYDESMIDEHLEEKMDLVIELISMGRNVRDESKIKIRQPISEVIIDEKYKSIIGELDTLILEELNVKDINYSENMDKYVYVTYKPNFKEVGSTFGSSLKEFQSFLLNMNESDINNLENNKLEIKLSGVKTLITENMVLKFVTPKEGYKSAFLNNKVIVLNTNLNDDLLLEGFAREFNSKIQNMRKESGFDVADRIKIYYSDSKEMDELLNKYESYIKDEALCVELIKSDTGEDVKINDVIVKLNVEKVK